MVNMTRKHQTPQPTWKAFPEPLFPLLTRNSNANFCGLQHRFFVPFCSFDLLFISCNPIVPNYWRFSWNGCSTHRYQMHDDYYHIKVFEYFEKKIQCHTLLRHFFIHSECVDVDPVADMNVNVFLPNLLAIHLTTRYAFRLKWFEVGIQLI